MLGSYDFCGHYEWTFAWLEREGGRGLVKRYWDEAINHDSQRHARELILREGFEGMAAYWGHTLAEESPERGFHISRSADAFRIDMHDCPSKGFLIRNGLAQYPDYCDHCIGWIGPLMRDAGFVIDHEHNHRGQCWWEMRRAEDAAAPLPAGGLAGSQDVRLRRDWPGEPTEVDRYIRAHTPDAKRPPPGSWWS